MKINFEYKPKEIETIHNTITTFMSHVANLVESGISKHHELAMMEEERKAKKEKHVRKMSEKQVWMGLQKGQPNTDIEIQAAWGRRELIERLETLQDEIITVQEQIGKLEKEDDEEPFPSKVSDEDGTRMFWTDKPEP